MNEFKKQLLDDIENIFHNPDEFSTLTRIKYNGKTYRIPAILDYEGATERKILAKDNGEGIFISCLTLYIPTGSLKTIPRKETEIEVDGNCYNIGKVSLEDGEIVLELEMFDE